MTSELAHIRRLVGNISPRQYRHVDVALAKELGVFTPVSGQCDYATSPRHTHPSYSFVLSFDGATSVLVDGKTLRAEAGELSCMGPRVAHQELPSERPPRYAAILIAPEYFETNLSAYRGARLPPLRGECLPVPLEFSRMVKEFMVECESELPGRDELVEAHALRLCHGILRLILGVKITVPSGPALRMDLNRAVEFAESHLHEAISVTDLAQAAGLSVSHFSREFQRELGKGPKEYLLAARLARARKLLLLEEGNITEVSRVVGFGSSAHFASAFRAAFGTTPSAFRRAAGRKRIS